MLTHEPSESPVIRDKGPHRGREYSGRQISVYFEASRCRHFAECVRGLPKVFDSSARPWISADAASPEAIAEVVQRCPSGALQYTSDSVTPERPASDGRTDITAEERGLLRVRGDIRWHADGGATRETRLALCGCGRSARRPYCDASCEDAQD